MPTASQLKGRSGGLKRKSWADHMHSFHFFACTGFRFVLLFGRSIELLGELQGFPREFVGLIAQFVSITMICLAVGNCCSGVGVRCEIVKFCGATMGTLRHDVLLACWMQTVRKGLRLG